MNFFNIVMPYYENGDMLTTHLLTWLNYPKEIKKHFKAVIVDDGSPNKPAINYLKGIDVGFPIELYRIFEDIPWNQHGAKNLGMSFVKGICLLTDIDHLLDASNAKKLVLNNWDLQDKIYKPLRKKANGLLYKRHPNTFLLTKENYWEMDGYDESFTGYYGTDAAFRRRLQQFFHLLDSDVFSMILYGREVIKDASTNPDHYGRKDSIFHLTKESNPELYDRKREAPKPILPLNFTWEKVL